MSEAKEEKPKQSAPKNFQEEVADAIVKGDLAAFKKCCVGKNDINRRLLPHKELKPVPQYNPLQRYINIKGPTMLMFAILCEQDKIVEYILDAKNPDVSIKVEGYNCLHLAAMVKDPKCLQFLLQHEWIQENIDEPIDLLGTNAKENERTTALHVAVSNRRYANAILLLSPLPKPRWSSKKDKKPKEQEGATDSSAEKPAEGKETTEEEEDVQEEERNPASINQKSASGSTPLYIAVFLHDFKMVRILLSQEADPSIECAKGKTPLQLALEIQAANNEKKAKIQAQQTNQKKKGKAENDEIDQIVTALQNAETEEKPDTLEVLKKELAPELIEKKEHSESSSSDEEDQENEVEEPEEGESHPTESSHEKEKGKEKEKKKSKASSASQERLLGQIFDQLKQLNARVALIENERRNQVPGQVHQIDANISRDNVCTNCGASGARTCPQCHKCYCDTCYRKQNVHKCTNA